MHVLFWGRIEGHDEMRAHAIAYEHSMYKAVSCHGLFVLRQLVVIPLPL